MIMTIYNLQYENVELVTICGILQVFPFQFQDSFTHWFFQVTVSNFIFKQIEGSWDLGG